MNEVLKVISEHPEKAYEALRRRRPVSILKQGKYPWDYPENWGMFEIRDKRTGKTYPMEERR